MFFIANFASATTLGVGSLVFEGFLTSDVTALYEVFEAVTKKNVFSRCGKCIQTTLMYQFTK